MVLTAVAHRLRDLQRDHSFRMIRDSHECVINLPTIDFQRAVVRTGNCSGQVWLANAGDG